MDAFPLRSWQQCNACTDVHQKRAEASVTRPAWALGLPIEPPGPLQQHRDHAIHPANRIESRPGQAHHRASSGRRPLYTTLD